jgi:PucR C-terminal helix-turn-helix domain/GGDEF-like domain
VLSERLSARRAEIEQAVLTRVHAVSDPSEATDPEYVNGLRAAVAAAVAYALAAVELGEERSPPAPPVLLAQARMAARNGVGLDTVLRRYFAGHALVGDYLVEEAERDGLKGIALQRLLRAQATLFDRLLAAVSEEYAREADSRLGTSEERRAERLERLLAGELLDTSEFAYDFEGFHLGAIASGPGAADALGDLANSLDRRLLLVRYNGDTVWAWLGSRRRTDPVEIERLVASTWPPRISLAIGEPAENLAGWRLTLLQARAAMPIALRSPEALIHYADVALLASALQDDLLSASLHQLYLAPLEGERDGGETARQTLRAYFAAGRNVSSAAAALGVSRQAVNSRLRAIEERLGRSLGGCATELEVALHMHSLEELDGVSSSSPHRLSS